MTKPVVVLSFPCAHCSAFVDQFQEWLNGEAEAIVVHDLCDRVVRELLSVIGITELPAVVHGGVVDTGSDAFAKVRGITGAQGGESGGTSINTLYSQQSRAGALEAFARRS